jgi:hypothetical protein
MPAGQLRPLRNMTGRFCFHRRSQSFTATQAHGFTRCIILKFCVNSAPKHFGGDGLIVSWDRNPLNEEPAGLASPKLREGAAGRRRTKNPELKNVELFLPTVENDWAYYYFYRRALILSFLTFNVYCTYNL